MRALLRHPPFPARAQPVAVAAGLQFLSLNGWRADLDPPATAVVVVEALASGQLSAVDAAAWLEPRLTPARRPPVARARSGFRRPAALPAARVPAGRVAAGALLTVAVTGFTLLAAACSRGPAMPASPAGGVSVVQPGPRHRRRAARAPAPTAAWTRSSSAPPRSPAVRERKMTVATRT